MTKEEKEELNKISKQYGVKILFKNLENTANSDNAAYYDDNVKTIVISKKYTKIKSIIPMIFHELGHKHCYDNNLFIAYGLGINARLLKLTALKAERFVDRWAAKEMKKQGYKLKYPFFYYQKDRAKAMKESILKEVEDILKRNL